MSAAQQVAAPTQQGVGGEDQLELAKWYSGEAMQERGEQRAIGSREPRLADLPLPQGKLLTQRQDFGVLVAVAHRQKPNTLVKAK